MKNIALMATLISLLSATLALAQGESSSDVPERTFAGQTLEVRDQDLDLGEVFYVWPGEDAQLAMISSAPEQQVVLTSNRIVGYAIVPFEREEAASPLAAASFRMPVVQLTSGIDGVDQLLHGPMLLDAASHPEVGLQVVSFSDVSKVEQSDSQTVFRGTMTMEVQAKGGSRRFTFPAQVSLRPFLTMAPRNPVVGDRLVIEGQFEVTPEDLGLTFADPRMQARMSPRIAETLGVRLYLMLGNVDPEKPGNPVDDPRVIHSRIRLDTLLRDLRDAPKAYAYARGLMKESWDDAETLNHIANSIATAEIQPRDLGLALKAASRAVELSEEKNPAYLDTLAEVYFLGADYAQAVQWQEKAAALAQGRMAAPLQSKLARYKAFAAGQ
ncbi:MAG TPA: YceI family protein [Acidobacteriota bacterium]|nr:YceI family protein [Acidobacteriota bacterium]